MSRVWIKSALGLACVLSVATSWARAQTYTIGGFTFDQNNTPTHLTKITSWNHVTDVSGIGEIQGSTTWLPGFDVGRSTGRLVDGYTPLLGSPGNRSRMLPLGVQSLTDFGSFFSIFQLDWNGGVLTNGPGDDFAIFEAADANNPEAFAVRVRSATTGALSSWRHEKADTWTDIPNTDRDFTATGLNLLSFGAGFEAIDAIQIVNLLSSSRVDTLSGEGVVSLSGTDAGFTFQPLQGSGGGVGTGGTFLVSQFDPDIAYVAALGGVTQAVPEPQSWTLVAVGVAGLLALVYPRQKRLVA